MKLNSYILFISILFYFYGSLKGQVIDDFSDGDYQTNPAWDGDTAKFEVDTSLMLHLNAPAVTDVAYLSTPSQSVNNATWEFYTELTFNPSSSNLVKVYLISNQSDLSGTLNGYFVEIGGTSDEVSLYLQDGLTTTKIIDGIDGKVNQATVTVRVLVTRDSTGFWTLSCDSTGGSTYLSEGSVLDNTYFQSNYFGVYCQYTSTRSNKFWFDDFNVTGQPFTDTIPPDLSSINPTGNTTLDLYFSEFIDKVSAETAVNYFVDNGVGTPLSAVRDPIDSSIVHLVFSNPFGNAVYNTLHVYNILDLSNNVLITDSDQFIWFIPVNPAVRSVIINEIFADPSPQIGLPPSEFIELYNPDTNAYDLKNWQFSDGSSIAVLPSYILLPGAHLILCSINDTGSYSYFGDVVGLSVWPTLNNSGDSLFISDSTGFIIDHVAYTDEWYKDDGKKNGGWSLEQINPLHPCSGENNWHASYNPDGGSPGTQNSVYSIEPDSLSPLIENITVLNLNKLYVTFNEIMDSASISNATYTINHGITVTQVVVGQYNQSATIYITPAIDSATDYVLVIIGAKDCYQNTMNDSIHFGIGMSPELFDILISEIMADPEPMVGLPAEEYVELFNASDKLINLQGCFFTDQNDTSVFGKALIFPNDYLILTKAGNAFYYESYGLAVDMINFPSLNNTGDKLGLLSADTLLLHSVRYSDSWYKDDTKKEGGWALEIKDPSNPCAGTSNWSASIDPSGGTPARINSVNGPNPDNSPPQLLRADAGDANHLRLTFSEVILKTAAESATYSIDNGITITLIESTGDEYIQLTLTPQLQAGITYTITVSGLTDCVGNASSGEEAIFGLPEHPNNGELIINEVLFNPRTSGSDFVEIYNNSNKFINLEDWQITSFDTDIDSISDIKIINEYPFEIHPHSYLVLTDDVNNIMHEYPEGKQEVMLQLPSMPPYNNGDGIVIITDADGTVFDRFDYNEDMHYPLLNSVDGVSLERIDFDRQTNDPTSWHSAAQTVGFATPGYLNSQYSESGSVADFNVEPEVFSPDNDGFDDVVNMVYHFDQPDYVANLLIFDSKGRVVRTLVKNELLGTEGVFSWDGINDEREKAAIGIYIIYFEAFSQNGNVQIFKKKCVLASKL